jgi:hypothetical protein
LKVEGTEKSLYFSTRPLSLANMLKVASTGLRAMQHVGI